MKIIIFLFFVTIGLRVLSQNIYFEDFSNDWKKGATSFGGIVASQPSDGNWTYVIVGSPDNDGGSASSWNDMAFMDGASVMSSNGSNSSTLTFRWNDVNNGSSANRVDWYSKEIVGNYVGISLSTDYVIGNGGSSNSIWVYYIIDGGTPILFGSSINKTSASGTFTISNLSCSISIQILVKAQTVNSNSAYVFIDNVSMTGASPLPIELLSFEGRWEEEGNILNWTTATEQNNDYFTIRWSKEGREFLGIAKVDGAGNSTSTIRYSHIDEYPSEGVNYYILRQTDYDGRFKDSEIISVVSKQGKRQDLISCTNLLGQEVDTNNKGIIIMKYRIGTKEFVIKNINF